MSRESKVGDAWINSRQKRIFEVSLIGGVFPILAGTALVASGVIASRHGPGAVLHQAERSLYPGHLFLVKKIGDPESDDLVLKVLQKSMFDELPQTIDILRGRMSLFGPRGGEPEYVEKLFAAIDNEEVKEGWRQDRSTQKPGLINSYAIHSHSRNLEGATEEARFNEEETLRENAHLRARLDRQDRENTSFGYDLRLLGATARMAAHNYYIYMKRLRSR